MNHALREPARLLASAAADSLAQRLLRLAQIDNPSERSLLDAPLGIASRLSAAPLVAATLQDGTSRLDMVKYPSAKVIQITRWLAATVAAGDGTVLSVSRGCDGIKDCADGSDETCGPNSPYEFACDDGSVLHVTKVKLCDGIASCPDGSDESHCGPCSSNAKTVASSFSIRWFATATKTATTAATKPIAQLVTWAKSSAPTAVAFPPSWFAILRRNVRTAATNLVAANCPRYSTVKMAPQYPS